MTVPTLNDPAASFSPAMSPVALVVDAAQECAGEPSLNGLRKRLDVLCAQSACVSVTVRGLASDDELAVLADALDRPAVRLYRAAPRPAMDVLPRCGLLVAEHGVCHWSSRSLMAPPESAWVPVQLYLPDCLEGGDDAVSASLVRLLGMADRLHDTARWPTSRMQYDSWLNRRVALEVTGIGDCVLRHGLGLAGLHRLLGYISARCQHWSRAMACLGRPLPALREADPARQIPPGPLRDQWRLRWQAALRSSGVRHRNLTALSPWSLVFRRGRRLDTELLSLLIHADAIYAEAPPEHLALTACERVRLGHSLASVLQQRRALDQIAKPV